MHQAEVFCRAGHGALEIYENSHNLVMSKGTRLK